MALYHESKIVKQEKCKIYFKVPVTLALTVTLDIWIGPTRTRKKLNTYHLGVYITFGSCETLTCIPM